MDGLVLNLRAWKSGPALAVSFPSRPTPPARFESSSGHPATQWAYSSTRLEQTRQLTGLMARSLMGATRWRLVPRSNRGRPVNAGSEPATRLQQEALFDAKR